MPSHSRANYWFEQTSIQMEIGNGDSEIPHTRNESKPATFVNLSIGNLAICSNFGNSLLDMRDSLSVDHQNRRFLISKTFSTSIIFFLLESYLRTVACVFGCSPIPTRRLCSGKLSARQLDANPPNTAAIVHPNTLPIYLTCL